MRTPDSSATPSGTPQTPAGPPIPALLAVFFAACLALFWQATGYPFLNFLENAAFLAHPEIHETQKPEWAFSSAIPWQPLAWISHMMDFSLFGAKSGAHRTVSILIHALNMLLVYVVFRNLTGAFKLSLVTAVLWGIHPMRVEPVVWLVERRMLLATFFVLLAMAGYPGLLEHPRSWWRRFALWIPALLAALSHPVGAILPVLLLATQYWPLRRPFAVRAFEIPLWIISLGTIGLVLRGAPQPESNWILGILDPGPRIATLLQALFTESVLRTVIPHPLSALYWHPTTPWMIAGLLALPLVFFTARRWPEARAGWLWFFAALFPTLGLLHPEVAAWGDRGTYLAHIGLIAAAVWIAASFGDKARLAGIGAAALWTILTFARIPAWQDTQTALQITVDYGNGHPLARYLLAQHHISQNMGVDAEKQLLPLIAERPRAIEPRLLHGSALALQRKFEEASAVYREVIRQAPNRPEGYYGLGMMQTNMSQLMPGIESFGEAIKRGLPPAQEAAAENAIAQYWLSQQKWQLAEQHARRAWELVPVFAAAHRNYGIALARQEKIRQAFAHIDKRARVWTKDDPAVVEVWTELFNRLAIEEKKREAEEEAKLSKQKQP